MDAKLFSSACERNREPILGVLREHFQDRSRVLEIGSGSGQHAVHFAAALPHLTWQTSDRAENLAGIRLWLKEAGLANTPKPFAFDVNDEAWPQGGYDAIFSANTLHIMAWPEVEALFSNMRALLDDNGKLAVYGPFNYGGRFTSASNAAFDASLKARDARMGIRDFEAVNHLADGAGLTLAADAAMPANNRCLLWQRVGSG
ncbi:MAG: class I SAM-dependent methyltransferase [Gammaproteobacteria bacterium]|nr:class I SAM-dependent methyltransferase [Gammaproteobacteria bacterium]